MRVIAMSLREYAALRDLVALMMHNIRRTTMVDTVLADWDFLFHFVPKDGCSTVVTRGAALRHKDPDGYHERNMSWDDYMARWELDGKREYQWSMPEGMSVEAACELLVAELVIAFGATQSIHYARYEMPLARDLRRNHTIQITFCPERSSSAIPA